VLKISQENLFQNKTIVWLSYFAWEILLKIRNQDALKWGHPAKYLLFFYIKVLLIYLLPFVVHCYFLARKRKTGKIVDCLIVKIYFKNCLL
jgi:hypothetical protein